MKKKIPVYVFALMIMSFPIIVTAQSTYSILPDQVLKVEGTSTVHDWHMDTKEAIGEASLVLKKGQVQSIESMSVSFAANSLKSGKGGMDKNAYKALKEKDFKTIQYELVAISAVEGNVLNAEGKLTIAGQSREISFPVNYVVHEDGSITFKGACDITFEMFELEPPTAVFGTIKTGNDLKLSFETTFAHQQ